MFKQRLHYHIEPYRTVAFVLTRLLHLIMWNAPAEARDLCAAFEELALNTTFRSSRDTPASGDCYRLVVPAPGILTLDASAPEAEPRLEFLGQLALQGRDAGRFRLVVQSPRGVVVEAETSGTFLLTVAPEDPSQPLAAYKLRNAFVGKPTSTTARVVFCDPLLRKGPGGESSMTLARIDNKSSLPTKTVDEEECEVLEVNSGPYNPTVRLWASCSLGEVDDHGDTPLCATPLAGFSPL